MRPSLATAFARLSYGGGSRQFGHRYPRTNCHVRLIQHHRAKRKISLKIAYRIAPTTHRSIERRRRTSSWRSSILAPHAIAQVDYVDPTIGNVGILLEPTRPAVFLPNSMVRVYPIRDRRA